MHRPSFAETTWIASRRYVPLRKLLRIEFPDTDGSPDGSERERAIALALAGQRQSARDLFEREATFSMRSTWRTSPLWMARRTAPRISTCGLSSQTRRISQSSSGSSSTTDRAGPGGSPDISASPMRRSARSPFCGARCEPRRAGRASGGNGLLLSDRRAGRRGRRCRERAEALEEAAVRDRGLQSGACWRTRSILRRTCERPDSRDLGRSAAGAGGAGGFLEEILGNLTPEMTQLVRNTFLSVPQYARARWPHQTRDILDFNYTFKVTKRTSLPAEPPRRFRRRSRFYRCFWTDRYRRTWRRAAP